LTYYSTLKVVAKCSSEMPACKSFISVPLSYLCNRVLFEGVFPDKLKYAEIVPVYKRDDKKDLSNYRPIYIF
jgi:hypothetical protein